MTEARARLLLQIRAWEASRARLLREKAVAESSSPLATIVVTAARDLRDPPKSTAIQGEPIA